MEFVNPADIRGYHAHCYFTERSRADAEQLRDWLRERFINGKEGSLKYQGRTFVAHEDEGENAGGVFVSVMQEARGPHVQPYFLCAFVPALFAEIVPLLMMNRGRLSILIHPETGYDADNVFANHTSQPLWIGPRLPFRYEYLAGVYLDETADVAVQLQTLFKKNHYTPPPMPNTQE